MVTQKDISAACGLSVSAVSKALSDYSDISDMLGIKIGSLYNFLNGQYNLSQSKAKMLRDWLSDRE